MPGPRDYVRSTIMALAHYSGGLCYWPGCPEPVLREVEGKVRYIVEIAHICAADPGGPRYDDMMTDDERRDFPNLILLCDPHHDLVDDRSKEDLYPTELIRRWKSQREAAPREALKRLREVTPSGLRKIVAQGLAERDAQLLDTLGRLEDNDQEAAILMRRLIDELTEAYARFRDDALNPDMVLELSDAAQKLHGLRDVLTEFANAAQSIDFRRLPRDFDY